MNALARGRVVRNDDGRPRMRLGQPAFKPGGVGLAQRCAILRRKQAARGLVPVDFFEIADQALRLLHGQRARLAFALEQEISPERSAEKTHTLENDFVTVQHLNLGASTQRLELAHGARHAAAVELVVVGHIKHGPVKPADPFHRIRWAGNVSARMTTSASL